MSNLDRDGWPSILADKPEPAVPGVHTDDNGKLVFMPGGRVLETVPGSNRAACGAPRVGLPPVLTEVRTPPPMVLADGTVIELAPYTIETYGYAPPQGQPMEEDPHLRKQGRRKN